MYYYSPIQWTLISILGLFTLIINGYIFVNEIKKRNSGKAKFASKSLKVWSFVCMLSGVITAFSVFTLFFTGVCYVISYIDGIFRLSQPVFMGLYQIARLRHCFSDNNAIGYPNFVFTVMYATAFLLVMGQIVAPFVKGDVLAMHCGIDAHYYHYVDYIGNGPISDSTFAIYAILLFTIYFLWDIITLLLYTYKIGSFKKLRINTKNIKVYKRILAVLHRVLIITLFYEIMFLVFVVNLALVIKSVSGPGFYLTRLLASIVYTYSVYIMLEHNTCEYIKFIKILSYFKLNYLCCCYKYVVNDQLNVSSPTEELKPQIEVTKNETIETSTNATSMETNEQRTTTSDLKRYGEINRKVINAMKENMEDTQQTNTADLERYAQQNRITKTKIKYAIQGSAGTDC